MVAWRACSSPGRCTHRVFLADADLHRLLHHRAARDRRPPLQRYDGPHLVHPVPGGGDADRDAPYLRRSAGGRRLQVHSLRLYRAVALPTLLTVFTICAPVEIAARLRGGRGAFGWIRALPWQNPIMLAVAFSFIMLGFGGAGGLINMSYQLDTTIHNTQWITGHFHLIWRRHRDYVFCDCLRPVAAPDRTGAPDLRLVRTQLWLWFIGMIVTTFPWHWVAFLACLAAWRSTIIAIRRSRRRRFPSTLGGRRSHSSTSGTSFSSSWRVACARRPPTQEPIASVYRASCPLGAARAHATRSGSH